MARQVSGWAQEVAGDHLERARSAVGETYEQATARLEEAGLSAGKTGETLGQAAQDVRQGVRQAAQDTAGEAHKAVGSAGDATPPGQGGRAEGASQAPDTVAAAPGDRPPNPAWRCGTVGTGGIPGAGRARPRARGAALPRGRLRHSPGTPRMVFDTWFGLLRVPAVGTAANAALVLLLRAPGTRTPAKLNASNLVATVALGSTLATALLSESVDLAEGLLAFALVGLRCAVARLSVRWPRFPKPSG